MKIVKLNRRYSNFLQHGHTIGVRFSRFCAEARLLELTLIDIYGGGLIGVKHGTRMWDGYFLKDWNYIPGLGSRHPYLITFKDESILTLFLLKNQALSEQPVTS